MGPEKSQEIRVLYIWLAILILKRCSGNYFPQACSTWMQHKCMATKSRRQEKVFVADCCCKDVYSFVLNGQAKMSNHNSDCRHN